MKKFFKTLNEAKKAVKLNDPNGFNDLRIWDLGQHRNKRRFFVGTKFEWFNL